MDAALNCVVALLKSSITGKKEELADKVDLLPLLPVFKKHHITSMIYDGALLRGYPANDPAMQELFRNYCRSLQFSAGQQREMDRVFQAFENGNIDYMPLKGSNLRAYYPKPEYRYMGDADVLIRLEQYEAIQKILTVLDFEFVYESEHELIWRSNYLLLELHKQLIPDKNTGFAAYFGDGWRLARKCKGHCYSMTTEDTFLFLLTHFAKHYQDGGVGFRYVTDLWLFRQKHPDLNVDYLNRELDKLQISTFVRNLEEMMSVWFDGKPGTDLTDVMSQYIYNSGSWGTNDSRLVSEVLRKKRNTPVGFNSKLVYLSGILFPSRVQLQSKYKILKKAPWMTPVVWLIRPFYKLMFENKSAIDKLSRTNEITEAGVDLHRQMLEYVGLDCDI